MTPRSSLALLLAAGLAGCSGVGKKTAGTPDNEPTLKVLANREIAIPKDAGVKVTEEQTIAAYKKFLEAAPRAPQRNEAMRRLGDLEMESADSRFADGKTSGATPDYRVAIARYQEFLRTYPNDPGNDRIVYQLARAHEESGALEVALQTLDRLVREYPQTPYADEAQFRRGELLFATKDYPKAEVAYTTVLKSPSAAQYRDRALYMQGWSRFKQSRLEDGLQSFFGVLDETLGNRPGDGPLESIVGLSRADRELVDDTFRVTSLSLSNLQGAETIPPLITSDARRSYEFRVYEQLGDLYIKQDRVKDAADTYGAFARRHPLHAQAPQLQTRVIEIYERNGFANLALDAKKAYVQRYGIDNEFRRANPQGWAKAQPLVKTHLAELARFHHASAQKTKATTDYQEAVRWYRATITAFPTDPGAAQSNFLLAELLYEDSRFPEAAAEYQKTAYDYPVHTKSADAGYAALLAYAAQEKKAAPADLPALQRAGIDSAVRFARTFPADTRGASVLTNAAEKLYALKDPERAAELAQQVLALNPPAPAAQRRVAWTVVAQTAFERSAFAEAERGYGEALALVPANDPGRADLVERQAASIYKQAEAAKTAGKTGDAVALFSRVGSVAPTSTVRAAAQYDAAAAQIAIKDWDGAIKTLEDFRTRFPNHPLQAEVNNKLAVAYLEKKQFGNAAGELERMAASQKDPKLAREALWQAAEMHEKAGSRARAASAYERYMKLYPEPVESSLEVRYRLAKIAAADGNAAREFALMREIFQADQRAGATRTERTRTLGAQAALAMTAPSVDAYKKVALVEPLAKNLKLKKDRMQDALKAFGVATDYGVADVTTAATFQIAALYQDFGKAMMASQRPKKLNKAELEQYNVMLEEQAYPFEEKAIELHELNARRAKDGLYDQWVQKSFKALGELRPVRYGKLERSEATVDAIR